jgi:hypothetical protein
MPRQAQTLLHRCNNDTEDIKLVKNADNNQEVEKKRLHPNILKHAAKIRSIL